MRGRRVGEKRSGIEAKREENKNEDMLGRRIMKRRRNKGEANRMVTRWRGP